MEGVYEVIKNIAVYLILVTVLLNLVNGSSYKKYVGLVCGMILILIVLLPVTNLLSLEDDFQYNWDLSNFKVEMMDTGLFEEAEETQQKKLEEEYKQLLQERITAIVEKEGRDVKDTEILLSEEDYGVITELTVVISDEEKVKDAEEPAKDAEFFVEQVQIEKIAVSETEETKQQEVMEKNKVTEAIRKELASEFAMKEERIIVYQKEG